jgi:very-short-patch-repair endonuclease
MAGTSKPRQRPTKAVRRDASEGERRLWTRLRRKQVGGATFRRQYPIHDVTASFACIARKTVVEFDNSKVALPSERSHEERRLHRITSLGWKVILVTHEDVFHDLEAVARAIEAKLPPPIHPETTPQKDGARKPAPEPDMPPETGWQP